MWARFEIETKRNVKRRYSFCNGNLINFFPLNNFSIDIHMENVLLFIEICHLFNLVESLSSLISIQSNEIVQV